MYRCFRNEMDGKDIAHKFEISEQLVCRYRKKFEWDRRKRDWNNSNRATIEQLIKMREKAISDSDADAIWKIQKTIQAIDGEFDRLAYTIEIMEDFLAYLRGNYPGEFRVFQNILPDFLTAQRNKYKAR